MTALKHKKFHEVREAIDRLKCMAAILELKLETLRDECEDIDVEKKPYRDAQTILMQEVKALNWQIEGLSADLSRILVWKKELVGGDVLDENYWIWSKEWVSDKKSEAFEKIHKQIYKEVLETETRVEGAKQTFERLEKYEEEDTLIRKKAIETLREMQVKVDPFIEISEFGVLKMIGNFRDLNIQYMSILKRSIQAMMYEDPPRSAVYRNLMMRLEDLVYKLNDWHEKKVRTFRRKS